MPVVVPGCMAVSIVANCHWLGLLASKHDLHLSHSLGSRGACPAKPRGSLQDRGRSCGYRCKLRYKFDQ